MRRLILVVQGFVKSGYGRMFNKVTGGMDEYWDYVKGNIEHPEAHEEGEPMTPKNYASNRMPLWVKPDAKVSVHDMMNFMRDHLENTELDMSKDAGAGPYGVPYRWRPLTWKVDGVTYCNERATATQQTGFSFVTQSRSWLPDEIGGIIWCGVDDASGTCLYAYVCKHYKHTLQFCSRQWFDDGMVRNFRFLGI